MTPEGVEERDPIDFMEKLGASVFAPLFYDLKWHIGSRLSTGT